MAAGGAPTSSEVTVLLRAWSDKDASLPLIDLDRALEGLASVDARKAKVVELRFFGGLSVEKTADVLHVSNDTVKRDWRLAKLWLLRSLDGTRDE